MRRIQFTVNGGLEDFARRELGEVFRLNNLKNGTDAVSNPISIWIDKGHYGSRIHVDGIACLEDDPAVLFQSLRRLRFVEYVSIHLGTAVMTSKLEASVRTEHEDRSKEDLLDEIAKSTETILSSLHPSKEKYLSLWKALQEELRGFPVGLEPFPGRPLPTPASDDDGNELHRLKNYHHSSFKVNTIYTRPSVAEMVVHTLKQVVGEQMIDNEGKILWLDAGCGTHGSLLQYLPPGQRIGVDIQLKTKEEGDAALFPNNMAADMHEADFLNDVTAEWLESKIPSNFRHTVVISNPPFSVDSRGNYKPIAQFIRHSFDALSAEIVGVIVPTKFARQRLMHSIGLPIAGFKAISERYDGKSNGTQRLQVLARMNLPDNSFYDPYTFDTKNIASTFLVLSRCEDGNQCLKSTHNVPHTFASFRLQVEGHRNKSEFPTLRTEELERAVQIESKKILSQSVISSLDNQDVAVMTINANLARSGDLDCSQDVAELELYMLLNPKRPLSLVNCICRDERIDPPHSLGWLSTSCKPSIAYAMLKSIVRTNHCATDATTVVVNGMCGEGTIEIEAHHYLCQGTDKRESTTFTSSFFLMSGDSSWEAVRQAKSRTKCLSRDQEPLVEFVQWDCQNLPLRQGIADAFLVDLPIAGGRGKCRGAKQHQAPSVSLNKSSSKLNYQTVIWQALAVLVPGYGQAAFLSTDLNTLKYSMMAFYSYWRPMVQQHILLGGLPGQFMRLERKPAITKDVSMWLSFAYESVDISCDFSKQLLQVARDACSEYFMDYGSWEMKKLAQGARTVNFTNASLLVSSVALKDVYVASQGKGKSHCYTITFNPLISNQQGKVLEKDIRYALTRCPPFDTFQLR
ncbi:RNA methylase family UPF0020 protein [Nitzschia inconspicua]|uniref:RNA methylase family UPF0020 protein n=1 Tax=Nitzschia inconspicua TaxID=303405 RepID=A0A9K3L3C5_9STRA|nr:RNA methylase family UPF0020 protein [Nitzschia inconspicua]